MQAKLFIKRDSLCTREKAGKKEKKVQALKLEEVSCFYNKREDLSHDHWEFAEIVKFLWSVADDPGVATENRESFCEGL